MLTKEEIEYLKERNKRRISQIKFDIRRNQPYLNNSHYKALVSGLEDELVMAQEIAGKLDKLSP